MRELRERKRNTDSMACDGVLLVMPAMSLALSFIARTLLSSRQVFSKSYNLFFGLENYDKQLIALYFSQ